VSIVDEGRGSLDATSEVFVAKNDFSKNYGVSARKKGEGPILGDFVRTSFMDGP